MRKGRDVEGAVNGESVNNEPVVGPHLADAPLRTDARECSSHLLMFAARVVRMLASVRR